jgi:nitrogen fixation protein FixH
MAIFKKDQIAYWSSEAFLNQYFSQLQFNEKYAKATGNIAGSWVRNSWTGTIRSIMFDFVRDYLKEHEKLPQGKKCFIVDWRKPNAPWLEKILLKKQVVKFPRIKGGYLE